MTHDPELCWPWIALTRIHTDSWLRRSIAVTVPFTGVSVTVMASGVTRWPSAESTVTWSRYVIGWGMWLAEVCDWLRYVVGRGVWLVEACDWPRHAIGWGKRCRLTTDLLWDSCCCAVTNNQINLCHNFIQISHQESQFSSSQSASDIASEAPFHSKRIHRMRNPGLLWSQSMLPYLCFQKRQPLFAHNFKWESTRYSILPLQVASLSSTILRC